MASKRNSIINNSAFQFLITLLIIASLAKNILAESDIPTRERSKWQAGAGLSQVYLPHYLGSNHYYNFTVPFPVVTYLGNIQEIDGEGARTYPFDQNATEVNFELNFRAPVFSEELDDENRDDPGTIARVEKLTNETRKGMPDLPAILLAGSSIKQYFGDHFALSIPFTLGFSAEDLSYQGWLFSPELELKILPRTDKNEIDFTIFQHYGSEEYNDLYYQVDPQFALQYRNAFDAQPGLVTTAAGFSYVYWLSEEWTFDFFYYYYDLKKSKNVDSPLIQEQIAQTIILAIEYRFYQSEEKTNWSYPYQ